ncbi:MAG TPA: hypothetical protein VFX98_17105 [Longimicrobiaceae bacterium]|nr:hypothetical protein [Longimicrobiaceae bacterium]
MRKIREYVLAILAALLLSVGTASVASAQADCSGCWDWFYADGWFYDDVGNIGSPGFYDLIGCDDFYCYYYGGGQT